ncbi:hypothetical protein BN1232_01754 [Mycobacterium lentiflavum]|uniref:Uncharacterized protein n=1 Tax=Mycobacterium lentiflavum TaxID=141349 RepID=A0A0E3WBU0_MYCLN|nr:hypothetical protein BN1232_01754 [Mycobacterium lentiflavum]
MLSAMCEVSAMIPITFGLAGYALVSRDGAKPDRSITQQRPTTTGYAE